MKALKAVTSVVLSFIIAFSFAACSSKYSNKNVVNKDGSIEFGKASYGQEEPVDIGTPDKELDPEKVYDSIEYKPDMFFGKYQIVKDSGIYNKEGVMDSKSEKFIELFENAESITDEKKSDEYSTRKLGTMPVSLEAGPSANYSLGRIKDFDYCALELPVCNEYHYSQDDDKKTYGFETRYFAMEVSGKTLKLKGFDYETQTDEEKNNTKVEYQYNGFDLEYEFSFKGRDLTLKYGDSSVTLTSCYKFKENLVSFNAYSFIKGDSEQLDGIQRIALERMHDKGNQYFTSFSVRGAADDYDSYYYGNARMSDNGLLTFTVDRKGTPQTYQLVYFFGGDELVLSDGEKTYFYTGSYTDYYGYSVGNNIETAEMDKIEEFSKEELEAINSKKTDLLKDLETEFKNEGIEVSVNRETGELAMNSTVLFGGDSAELSDEGKDFLNKFVKAYTKIIYNQKYDGFIKKTVVEGHIAPVDGVTYEKGLPLSKKRAENVKNYCLSVKDADTSKLKETIETVGYSQSKPIKNKDGKVDFDASRRVSFRFIINLDK